MSDGLRFVINNDFMILFYCLQKLREYITHFGSFAISLLNRASSCDKI